MATVVGAVGFTLGAIGFIVMVRNATEKILLDVNAWKQHSDKLVPLLVDLRELEEELQTWQNTWFITDETPGDILTAYWGRSAAGEISTLLYSLEKESKRIKQKFRTLYGDSYRQAEEYINTPNRGNTELSTLISVRERQIESLKRNSTAWEKLCAILWRNSVFGDHLVRAKAKVQQILRISERQFQLVNRGGEAKDWEAAALRFAAAQYLPRLAQALSGPSSALLHRLGQVKAVNFDLHLDHKFEPEECLQALLRISSQWTNYPYQLHLTSNDTNEKDHCLTCLRSDTEGAVAGVLVVEEVLQHLQQLAGAEMTPYRFTETGGIFQLTSTPCTCQQPCRFRSILSGAQPTTLHEKMERPQLAYELAQMALLLFGTQWLESLCSCAIILFRSEASPRHSYAVRLNNQDHLDPETGGAAALTDDLKPWCQSYTPRTPLRRLGLLLTELALNCSLVDVFPWADPDDIRVDLDTSNQTKNPGSLSEVRGLTRTGLSDKVFHISHDLADAVWYCLHSSSTASDENGTGYYELYEKVVLPLWLHYDTEIIQRLKKRKTRLGVRRPPG